MSTGSGDTAATTLQPGQSIRPNVSVQKAQQLIENYYNVKVESIKELNSYDDKNFYVKGTDENGQLRKFTFKVLNSMDSKKSGHVEAEHVAMQHLHDKNINCPFPLKSKQGQTYILVTLKNDVKDAENNESKPSESEHLIRLLSFVEGSIMYHVPPTPKLLQKAGKYIAQVEELIKDLSLPALDTHSSVWFLCCVLELEKFTYVIKDKPERFKLVSDVLAAYRDRVLPRLPSLPRGNLHGDFNEQNIIVQPSSTDEGEYDVHGLIDFGDLQVGVYVFDLAITLCYLMLECTKEEVTLDPFEGSQSIIKGYSSVRKIEDNEFEVLRILIACRMCQSLVMGAYTYSLDPGNEYLLTTATRGWAFLEKVWSTSDEKIIALWKNAIAQ